MLIVCEPSLARFLTDSLSVQVLCAGGHGGRIVQPSAGACMQRMCDPSHYSPTAFLGRAAAGATTAGVKRWLGASDRKSRSLSHSPSTSGQYRPAGWRLRFPSAPDRVSRGIRIKCFQMMQFSSSQSRAEFQGHLPRFPKGIRSASQLPCPPETFSTHTD